MKLEVLTPRLSQHHQILPISRSSFFFSNRADIAFLMDQTFPTVFFVAKVGGVEKGPSKSQSSTTLPVLTPSIASVQSNRN